MGELTSYNEPQTGLGHFYLGLMNRGLGIMIGFFGLLGITAAVAEITHSDLYWIFMALVPVVWFYGLFDALSFCIKIKGGETPLDRSPLVELTEALAQGEKSRFWALLFGLIPGAGQMYLGRRERGVQFMAGFFLTLFLVDSLRLSLFLFLLPLIWFYSFFDVLQLISGEIKEAPTAETSFLPFLAEKQRWIGFGLIFLGAVIIFDRMIVPYLDYRLVSLLQTGIVASLLIGVCQDSCRKNLK